MNAITAPYFVGYKPPGVMNRKEFRKYTKQLEKAAKQVLKENQREEQKEQKRQEEEEMACKEMISRIRKDVEEGKKIVIENDDIYQLFTDGYLTSYKITELKKVGIIKISQIKEMDHNDAVEKISKAKTIGKEIAENIILLVSMYQKKEETPKLTDVIMIDEKQQENQQTEKEKASFEKEDGRIDVEKFANYLVDENALGDKLLETVLNLCAAEKNVGMIHVNPTTGKAERVGGSNIIYNSKTLLMDSVFLKRKFDESVSAQQVRLLGVHERDTEMYFTIALKALGKEYIKVSFKDGKEFYSTRKDYTGNRLNYVQFEIEKIENRMNKKLSFDSSKKITRLIAEPVDGGNSNISGLQKMDGSTVYTIHKSNVNRAANTNNTNKEVTKMATIKVNPVKSQEFVPGSGEYVACFEVIEVSAGKSTTRTDKFNFDFTTNKVAMGGTDISRGYAYYIFNKISPRRGHYYVGTELQQYFDQIKFGIQEFLNN